MKVKEFIEKYNEAENKEEFLNERLTTDYVKYEVKVDVCEKILNATHHQEITDGVTVWHHRGAYAYVIYTQQLITAYTDIEFNDEDFMADFNELNRLDLINELTDIIPEREFFEFNTVMQMCTEDLESNERNILTVLNSIEQLVNAVANTQTTNIESAE